MFDVDLRHTPVGPQHADRPQGGFVGAASREPGEALLSHIERRELEAVRLLEEAHRQAELVQRDAYHAGFEQGEQAGEKLMMQKLEPTIQTFISLIEALQHERDTLIAQYEHDLIKVAFAIATRVVKRQIEMQSETVLDVVQAALARVSGTQSVKLHLAPIDAQLIEQQIRRGSFVWPPEHLNIVADEEIGRGGCRVVTETGDIDATIETQLRVLRNELWNE